MQRLFSSDFYLGFEWEQERVRAAVLEHLATISTKKKTKKGDWSLFSGQCLGGQYRDLWMENPNETLNLSYRWKNLQGGTI